MNRKKEFLSTKRYMTILAMCKISNLAGTFRKKGIPCEVMWMDIDYMDGFRSLLIKFPNPKALVNELHLNGFKAIWMLDPGIKHEEGYFVYDSGSKEDSVTKTMPESNIHRGDAELGGLRVKKFVAGVVEGYRLIPHIYTLFYMAHTKGTPIATPTFFADPKDSNLRKLENSFLLEPLLVCASTMSVLGSELPHLLPNGIWLHFDFEDSHADLPTLYLQGGFIIHVGPPLQHVGKANPTDDLSLILALDENGKAEGVIFEDDGDGYGFNRGLRSRPERKLHVQMLLGGSAKVLLVTYCITE
ncbi:hypothetical protein Syun_021442 [Stephania yunnanensis]|uniref:Glycoside hydrolase family 31 TIM barrel domain-containing protein n=1 Tax=Stephania yunnanensis TaxID=152371 RepID=A0AAP0IGE1_9MAGN